VRSGLARIVDDGEEGLLTVHHCLNNTGQLHASMGVANTSRRSEGVPGSPHKQAHAQISESDDESEAEDVLSLSYFVIPEAVAPVLEAFLLAGPMGRVVNEVLDEIFGDVDDESEDADVAEEALLVCMNLGLLTDVPSGGAVKRKEKAMHRAQGKRTKHK
jgi:hypothetical protein